MTHLVAIFFFSGLLVALALILQYTIRDSWADIVAALCGRPLKRHQVKPAAAVRVSVPRSGPRAAAF
jgi:hypothetical protein